MEWLAFDIGGANLKAADGRGYAASQVFPLWQKPRQLSDALRGMLQTAPPADHLAITMTGELADCFSTRHEGVQFILNAVLSVAERRQVLVYLTDGRLVEPAKVNQQPLLAAASNWHALAAFCGRFAPQAVGMVWDIGSTTTDIIPLIDGKVSTLGMTDVERLRHGELLYFGVERTPLCSLAETLPYKQEWISCANELFATTRDVYLTLDDLPPQPGDLNTANGKPATKSYARDRLARMLCCDRDSFTDDDARIMAEAIDRRICARLGNAWGMVTGRFTEPVETIILCGQGEFLARRLIERLRIKCRLVSLTAEIGEQSSRCAPAHALAVLAREGCPS